MIPPWRDVVAGLMLVAWLGLVSGGFAVWAAYDSTPGAVGPEPPAPTSPEARGGWELVLFAHPHCPCTRAALTELAEIVRTAGPGLAVRVAFVRPAGVGDGWELGELWDSAARLPNVRVECDRDGGEARRAGAATSGHAVLYDPSGRPVFRGGITRGRGKPGDSTGRRAVMAILAGEAPGGAAPVFGCPLFETDECGNPGGGECRR